MGKFGRTSYFKPEKNAPLPLEAEVSRIVRFEEVDALRIVWHGHFSSYFEDARTAFGVKYGLGYMDMVKAGYIAPIAQLHFDYHAPITYPEKVVIKIQGIWSEAAKMIFEYEIRGPENRLAVTGYTVQLFTDMNFQVQMLTPPFLEAFRKRWKEGTLS
jgi:acyl-CoA thioester hydrolase